MVVLIGLEREVEVVSQVQWRTRHRVNDQENSKQYEKGGYFLIIKSK